MVKEQGIDEDDVVRTCLSCGALQPYDGAEPDVQPRALTVAPKQLPWTETAPQEIRQIVAEYERLLPKLAHAEKTIAALRAYGIENLPILPWKMRKPSVVEASAPTGRHAPRTYSCTKCGRRLAKGEGSMVLKDGFRDYFCKGGCAPVAMAG